VTAPWTPLSSGVWIALNRQPRELEEFIVIADKQQVDLATTQGRLLTRAWAAFDAHKSEVRSERLKRAFLERARRQARRRVLRGESLHSLVADPDRRNTRTSTRKQWTDTHLRALLRTPGLAGLSRYPGEIVDKGPWISIICPADSPHLREIFRDRDTQSLGADSPNLLRPPGLWSLRNEGGTGEVESSAQRRRYACPILPGRDGCGWVSVRASVCR